MMNNTESYYLTLKMKFLLNFVKKHFNIDALLTTAAMSKRRPITAIVAMIAVETCSGCNVVVSPAGD